jgi:hypothetical protein
MFGLPTVVNGSDRWLRHIGRRLAPNGFLDLESPENVVPRFRTTGRTLVSTPMSAHSTA